MLKAQCSMPNAQRTRSGVRVFSCALSIALCALSIPVQAQQEPGFPSPSYDMMEPGTLATARLPQLENVTFKQRLNTQLPLDVHFKDENGRDVTLGQYFDGNRPVVLAFVYYSCPMLCTQVMNGVSRAVKVLPFTPGEDFDVVWSGAAQRRRLGHGANIHPRSRRRPCAPASTAARSPPE